jgi:hypothetical protein
MYFLCMERWFFDFAGCLVKEKNSYEVSACFFYQLLIIIIVPKAATKFLFCLSLAVSQLSNKFSESEAGFRTTFKVTQAAT